MLSPVMTSVNRANVRNLLPPVSIHRDGGIEMSTTSICLELFKIVAEMIVITAMMFSINRQSLGIVACGTT